MAVILHVNVDHVATLRQARGTDYPDPLEAARAAVAAGAAGVTVHLREDRRHIQPDDVERIRASIGFVNLEMAASQAMLDFALSVRPNIVTFVPEKREERTTEGGLDVVGQRVELERMTRALRAANIAASMFIEPDREQIAASRDVGAEHIELHTGRYCHAFGTPDAAHELRSIACAAEENARHSRPLHLAAGHGLTRRNVGDLLRAAPAIVELNVGHAIVADAVMLGFDGAVRAFLAAMRA